MSEEFAQLSRFDTRVPASDVDVFRRIATRRAARGRRLCNRSKGLQTHHEYVAHARRVHRKACATPNTWRFPGDDADAPPRPLRFPGDDADAPPRPVVARFVHQNPPCDRSQGYSSSGYRVDSTRERESGVPSFTYPRPSPPPLPGTKNEVREH